jgi:hypothetical protein
VYYLEALPSLIVGLREHLNGALSQFLTNLKKIEVTVILYTCMTNSFIA